nr:hypothetical protein [Tanacetum cinerariifolium]
MNPISSHQAALDNSLVAPEKRLKIKRCNARIAFTKPQKEKTFQVTLEAFKPWRTFVAVINKCISGKTTKLDRLRESQAQIFWAIKKEHMAYPRFTKVIIDHFISKDNTISMRNRINLHTVCDNSLLGTLKFLSKIEDCQKYGVQIPDGMINDDIKLSAAYKTYLDYATGKFPLKKARKFKKPSSPKLNIVPASPQEPTQKGKRVKRPAKKATTAPTTSVVIRDTPDKSVSKKKAPTKADRGKGIELLFDGALLEDAQLKKSLRKNNEGIGVKPGVLDVSKEDSFDSDDDSWGNREDENDDLNDEDDDGGNDDDSGNDDDGGNDAKGSKQTDSDDDDNPSFILKDYEEEEEEEQDEEYVHTLEKEKSDDEEKMYEEEDNDVVKELYGDLNITQRLRDTNMMLASKYGVKQGIIPEHTTVETPMNMSPANKAHFEAEKEAIRLILTGIGDEIYSTVDACQTAREMWEAIKRLQQGESLNIQDLMNEMIRNNLTVATMQVNVQFVQQLQPEWLRYKGKEIAKPITPPSETASEENSDLEQVQRDKDKQKNLALIAKYFKKIYKPTNNNIRTSSNSRNKNVDTTPRYKNDNQSGQFGNQRTVNVAGARENVGSPVVQQSGIQCFNCKEFGHFSKECRKPKRVKDSAYHKEKMLLCKQAEKCVSLQAEQYDWLADTDEEIDEQGLEAHYSSMEKIQEVPTTVPCTDSEPLEQVQNDTGYIVFANDLQHSEQSESISNTCQVETDDSNVIPDSPGMCDDDIQNDQNDVESDDECVALANLIANLKLDTEFEKYKAFNDRTVDYHKLELKMEILLEPTSNKLLVGGEDQQNASHESEFEKNEDDGHVMLTTIHDKTEGTMQSSSVSFDFTSKLLNLDNTGPDVNEIASLMNTSTIPPPPPPVNPSSHLTTIPQQQTPDSTKITTNPILTLPEIPNFASLFQFDQRVSALETKMLEFNQTNQFAEAVSSIPGIVDKYLASKNLYNALVEAYNSDNDIITSYGDVVTLKRGRDDQGKDEDPFAGSDRGRKRRNSSKDVEPSKGSKSKESKSSSSSKGTQSKPKLSGKSTQAEEPEFKAADTEMQHDQGNKSGHIDDQPDNQEAPKHDWFQKPTKPPTPDRAWNKSKSIYFRPPQKWISTIAKAKKPPRTALVGPTFNLLKGTCKSFAKLKYHFKECYKAVNDRLDWHNPEGLEYPFDLSKPLPLIKDLGHQVVPVDDFINNDLEYLKGGSSSSKYATSTTRTKDAKYDNVKGIEDMVPTLWSPVKVAYNKHAVWRTYHWVMRWYDYRYLEEIVVRRDDNLLYNFKEGDFPRLNLRDIEDLLLLLVQKKLSNLDVDDWYYLDVALRMFTRRIIILHRVKDLQLGVESYQKKPNITRPETTRYNISKLTPYTAYENLQGIIYQDKYKRNRLMHSDELYKFCDGSLSSVRSVLNDIASNLEMDYLPKRHGVT